MSSGPRTAVGRGIKGKGVVPKVGYPKGSGGAVPWGPRGYVFRGAFRLPPFHAKFSQHPMRHATNGPTRTLRGPLS